MPNQRSQTLKTTWDSIYVKGPGKGDLHRQKGLVLRIKQMNLLPGDGNVLKQHCYGGYTTL